MGQNYQKKLDDVLSGIEREGAVPKLLLHSCCAPCSSYCLEYLSRYFDITLFFYNPNIYPEEEYRKRAREQQDFISRFPAARPVSFLEGAYETERFYALTEGLWDEREGGRRCALCYELRLKEAAVHAVQLGMDYFTTTLSISPLKNADLLNGTGDRLAKEYGVRYLNSDFKKRDGYKRSVALSEEYGLYRQYYCGCEFSKKQRDTEIAQKEKAGITGKGRIL